MIDWKSLVAYLSEQLTEQSTWRGIIKLAALGAVLQSQPELWHRILEEKDSIDALVTGAIFLNGAVQVALPDRSEWFRRK